MLLFWVAQGVPSVNSNDQTGIAAAATAAGAADLVILMIGSDLALEREGADRTTIDFSAAQLALITAVANAAKTPVIAVVFSGGAVDVSPLLSNPKIGAVFWAGQPSVQISAIGDLIFGRTLDGRQYSPAVSKHCQSKTYQNLAYNWPVLLRILFHNSRRAARIF